MIKKVIKLWIINVKYSVNVNKTNDMQYIACYKRK